MTPPEVGDVIPYSYLWRREYESGEDAGRKVRPCVVVVATTPVGKDSLLVVVAPITSREPADGASAIALPGALKRALSLNAKESWVICDEVNQFVWPGYDIGLTPDGARHYGRIPGALLQRIRQAIVNASARSTKRDE